MGQATFSLDANYLIDVDAALVSQSGEESTIFWRVMVAKNNHVGYVGGSGSGSKGWADSSLAGINDLWVNNNLQFNFQNGSTHGVFTIASGTFKVQHRPDGNAEYYVNAGLTLSSLGTATAGTGTRSLPRIAIAPTATVPPAPTHTGFGPKTMTSLQYRFTSNGDGGSPLREWELHYGLSPFQTLGTMITNGSTTVTANLNPGTLYFFRVRGRNDVGWGPFNEPVANKTVAPAFIKSSGAWGEAVSYVKYNGVWKAAQPYVKINGIWKITE